MAKVLPEKQILSQFMEKKLTFAVAESCTGGLIAQRITELPGASAVFPGGVVCYTNEVKQRALGVRPETLDRFGAVSEPVAMEMAEGIQRMTGADFGVSVTGLAGPGGDDRGNPIGTVFVGLAGAGGCRVHCLHLHGTRQEIREKCADHVISWLSACASVK